MTREQAIRECKKRWGKKFLYRVGQSISSPQVRAVETARSNVITAEVKDINDDIAKRLRETPWYQELTAKKVALLKERQELKHLHYYKFQVGHEQFGCFLIEGEGDTWEEAFAAVDRKAGK